jgi:hypothetical protein
MRSDKTLVLIIVRFGVKQLHRTTISFILIMHSSEHEGLHGRLLENATLVRTEEDLYEQADVNHEGSHYCQAT